MIKVEVQKSKIERLLDRLGSDKTAEVLKNAINETARSARKQLAVKAQRTYVVKTGRFNKSMTIKNATKRKPEAIIGATGAVTELKDFKVSPSKFSTGNNRPKVVKGKGLRANSLKPLQKGDLKAFIIKFSNNHVSVAQRLEKDRLPIKILYSTSVPKMLGNEEKVYQYVEPDICNNLQRNLEKYISKALEEV